MSAGRVVQEIEVGGETKLLGCMILDDVRVRACRQTKHSYKFNEYHNASTRNEQMWLLVQWNMDTCTDLLFV